MPRAKRYFDLADDLEIQGRWHLHEPTDDQGREIEPWRFTEGKPVDISGRLVVPIQYKGRALDYNRTAHATPVVHARVAAIFSELAPQDVQLIPVDIQGHSNQFFILVATKLIRCIDEERSKPVFWTAEHSQPEKVGQYMLFSSDLRIIPSAVGDARVFRLQGWEIALIVSEDIKLALERAKVTGLWLTEV